MIFTLGILVVLLITYVLIVIEERFNDGHR
jgi:hypothetical protein